MSAPVHKSRLGAVVIDCRTEDLAEAARFWSAAFGYEPQGEEADPRYVGLSVPGDEPRIILQAVEHESRVHLDIETDDKEAEVERLEQLGAKRVAAVKGWVVMEAPTGHRFCVVGPQRKDFAGAATTWFPPEANIEQDA
ncbi:VOC family protein [Afifella sp. IM 167]|uniref:VOC family protein n=1 Tax=Afifella sp. IM 167 TaxID=2033586 RepID=UPI001CCE199C|nr:VOC family protein [Afifella sp. IM 167]MBZ8132759.1 glyoxalase [Afifella sp. IM 167]